MRASNFRHVQAVQAPFAGVIAAELELELEDAALDAPPDFEPVVPQPLDATPTISRVRRQEDFRSWIMRMLWFRIEFVKCRSLAVPGSLSFRSN